MNYKLILLLLTLLFVSSANAQGNRGQGRPSGADKPKIQLIGKVVDANTKQGLEFATISVFNLRDSSLVGGGLSGLEGVFELSVPMGRMYAEVEFIGFEKTIVTSISVDREEIRKGNRTVQLGEIALSSSALDLEEITIQAEKSTNQFTLDKRVFNVGQDLSTQGGSAQELLDNVPSVTVDIDGTVSLRGSSGVRILINGQPSRMVSDANGLRSIPADMIESVEVITNPSARYEAEGMAGIINIILKKERRSGFNGSLNSSVSYPFGAGIGANLNYRKNKINWFANYNVNYRSSPGYGSLYQEIYLDEDTYISEQTRDMQRGGLSNTIRGGMEYFFSETSVLTGAIQYGISDDNNLTTLTYIDYLNNLDNLLQTVERTDNEQENENGLQYNIDYNKQFSSRDHNLRVSFQYEDELEVESSDFDEIVVGTTVPSLLQRSENDEGQRNMIFRVDYTQPIGGRKDHKFEVGTFSSIRNIDNDFIVEELDSTGWNSLEGLTNDFDYLENVQAVYLQYGNTIGKFGFQVGLRGEYLNIRTLLVNDNIENNRDTLNFFPSLFLNYEFSEGSAIQASYSRRIRRPRFWDLNPFFSYSDNRNFFSGNPLVNPEYTNSYEINYLKIWEKATLTSGVFYRQTSNSITRIRTILDDNTFLTRPENLGVQDDFGVEVNGSLNTVDWLRVNGNINFFRSITTSGRSDINLDADTYAVTGRLMARASMKQQGDLQASVNYRSGRQTPQGNRKSITSIDVGWSRDFLPKKNLTLTLSVRDLLNDRVRRYETFGEDFYTQGEFQWRIRTFTLAANYRINQKKQRGGNRSGGGGDFEGGEF